MTKRKAEAAWNGDLKSGKGTMKLESGAFSGSYSFSSRFESGQGSNPEELIAAAHAGCFSMALSHILSEAGFEPERVSTSATVVLDQVGDDFAITQIILDAEGEVPGIDEADFIKHAETAKANCPVSKALAGTQIKLNARLI